MQTRERALHWSGTTERYLSCSAEYQVERQNFITLYHAGKGMGVVTATHQRSETTILCS